MNASLTDALDGLDNYDFRNQHEHVATLRAGIAELESRLAECQSALAQPKPDAHEPLTAAERAFVDHQFEGSKNDRWLIAGSEIRQLCGLIRRLATQPKPDAQS